MSKTTTALLIPCYNAERYLENLRKQVDALTPAFDQVILVDDGSTDGTAAKARELGFDIKQLGTNRGPGAARNALMRLTVADWIHFLDADDEISPDYLSSVLPLADEETDVVLSSCDFLGATDRKFWVRWSYDDRAFRSNALSATITTPVFLHCSFIRRRKAIEAGGFDEVHRCYEDGDFHVQLADAGARFRCIPDVLAVSLRHSHGSGGNALYCSRCRLAYLKKYRQYLPRFSSGVLADALAKCAGELYFEGDVKSSRQAFAVAFALGWKGVKSEHFALRLLSRIRLKTVQRWLFLVQLTERTSR